MRIHFEKLARYRCEDPSFHLPHIWYNAARFCRYFCKGWE